VIDAASHGVGVLRKVANDTRFPVAIQFQNSSYPWIKPNDSTDSFPLEDVGWDEAKTMAMFAAGGVIAMGMTKAASALGAQMEATRESSRQSRMARVDRLAQIEETRKSKGAKAAQKRVEFDERFTKLNDRIKDLPEAERKAKLVEFLQGKPGEAEESDAKSGKSKKRGYGERYGIAIDDVDNLSADQLRDKTYGAMGGKLATLHGQEGFDADKYDENRLKQGAVDSLKSDFDEKFGEMKQKLAGMRDEGEKKDAFKGLAKKFDVKFSPKQLQNMSSQQLEEHIKQDVYGRADSKEKRRKARMEGGMFQQLKDEWRGTKREWKREKKLFQREKDELKKLFSKDAKTINQINAAEDQMRSGEGKKKIERGQVSSGGLKGLKQEAGFVHADGSEMSMGQAFQKQVLGKVVTGPTKAKKSSSKSKSSKGSSSSSGGSKGGKSKFSRFKSGLRKLTKKPKGKKKKKKSGKEALRNASLQRAKDAAFATARAGAIGAVVGIGSMALARYSNHTATDALVDLIPFEVPDGKFRCPIDKNPLITGFGSSVVTGFKQGSRLLIKNLLGLGVVWLRDPLPTPLSFTAQFMVKVEDKGGLHIYLGKRFSEDFAYKLVLGAFDNTKAVLFKGETMVQEVSVDHTPLAGLLPGQFLPYWISVNKGLITAGFGEPGNNIIISYYDHNFDEAVDRLGFGNGTTLVELGQVQFSQPVVATAIQSAYGFDPDPITVSAEELVWVPELPFREPGRGAVSFERDGTNPVTVVFGMTPDEGAPQLHIPIGSNDTEEIILSYTDVGDEIEQEVVGYVHPGDWSGSGENKNGLWVSNNYGQICWGVGSVGSNVMGAIDVPGAEEADVLGFTSGAPETIRSIAMCPAVSLAPRKGFGKGIDRQFAGDLELIQPFAYYFRQAGQAIEVYDRISKEHWYPAKTPQQDATYSFGVNITPDGGMNMYQTGKAKNMNKFMKEIGSMVIKEGSSMMWSHATQIGSVDTYNILTNAINAGISTALSAVAVGTYYGGVVLEADAKFGYRDHDAYVYTENVKQADKIESSVDARAQQDRAAVEQSLYESQYFNYNDPKSYEYYLGYLHEVVKRVTHPEVVASAQIRTHIITSISTLYRRYEGLFRNDPQQRALHNPAMLSLLIDARQNRYLLNRDNANDRNWETLWSTWIQGLLQEQLSSENPVMIRPLFGEYIWLKDRMIQLPTKGSIYLEVEGLSDLFVGICEETKPVRNTDTPLYECVIGGQNNTKTFIRTKSLGRSVASVDATENTDASLMPGVKNKIWISCNDGVISIGNGPWGENKIVEWTDPYPLTEAAYVGVSTWNAPITFHTIRTGPPVEFITPQVREELLKLPAKHEKTAAELEKEKLMQDDFKDLQQHHLDENALDNNPLDNDPLDFDHLLYNDLDYSDLEMDVMEFGLDQGGSNEIVVAKKKVEGPARREVSEREQELLDMRQDRESMNRERMMNAMAARGTLATLKRELKPLKQSMKAGGKKVAGGVKSLVGGIKRLVGGKKARRAQSLQSGKAKLRRAVGKIRDQDGRTKDPAKQLKEKLARKQQVDDKIERFGGAALPKQPSAPPESEVMRFERGQPSAPLESELRRGDEEVLDRKHQERLEFASRLDEEIKRLRVTKRTEEQDSELAELEDRRARLGDPEKGDSGLDDEGSEGEEPLSGRELLQQSLEKAKQIRKLKDEVEPFLSVGLASDATPKDRAKFKLKKLAEYNRYLRDNEELRLTGGRVLTRDQWNAYKREMGLK
jgi:hypothetical protein